MSALRAIPQDDLFWAQLDKFVQIFKPVYEAIKTSVYSFRLEEASEHTG